MTESNTHKSDQASKTGKRVGVLIAVFAGIGAIVWAMFSVIPQSFDMELEQVGSGKPALVFIYDPNLVVSAEQLLEMDAAREAHGDDMHFLVAKIGYPDAQKFANEHNARSPDVLLFDQFGQLIIKQPALLTSQQMIQLIQNTVVSP